MKYEAKKFDHLLGTDGFSDTLLNNHFTLYQGYVANTNTLNEKLSATEKGTPEYAELKRRFGWEWNGMRLHELYFGNMTNASEKYDESAPLAQKIARDFGSFDAWNKDFHTIGAMRGIGWVILAYDKEADRLFNVWIDEHNTGHLAGATPLLVMDVFEHAFMIDYGLKRGEYVTAFMGALDWREVGRRLTL